MKTARKILVLALAALVLAAVIYFAAAWALSSVVQREDESGNGITLYLRSNGVHADIVMPLDNGVYDWRAAADPAATANGRNGAAYRTLPLADAHYTADDAFYEAEGRYHLFNTCNSWLNRRLTESGLRGVVWTPFAAPLLDAYRKP